MNLPSLWMGIIVNTIQAGNTGLIGPPAAAIISWSDKYRISECKRCESRRDRCIELIRFAGDFYDNKSVGVSCYRNNQLLTACNALLMINTAIEV